MPHLSNKTILLTGATGSIGQSIARELSAQGARVLLQYRRNKDNAEELAAEIGNGAKCLKADLGKLAAPAQLWKEAVIIAGRIDALVNNAGILSKVSVTDPPEQWQAISARDVQINFLAAADLCRSAITHFREHGGGRIVNMASRAAQGGYRSDAMPYGATKAALVNLTQSIARGYGPDNITAIAIAPGWVRTTMSEAFVAKHGEEAVLADIPVGRMAETEEIAELVAFVLRPSQVSLSGAVLDVNGASQMR